MNSPPSALPSIAIITAGAGGMICGSCLNDNTLARELTRQGVDIQLIPTYTPIRTDERDVSMDRVFFGGINVYLEQKLPVWGWLPRWCKQWLDRPRFLRWATSGRIKTDAKLLGPLAVSMLRGEAGRQKSEVLELVQWLAEDLRPGLVQLSNMLIAGFVPTLKRRYDVPVLVSLQGDDIFLGGLLEPYRRAVMDQMRRLDASIDGYLVHSEYYGEHMAQLLGLPREKFHRVPLGIAVEDFLRHGDVSNAPPSFSADSAGSASTGPPPVTIGYLARLAPEKGLGELCDAFCELKRQPATRHARLRVAGWLGADHVPFADEAFGRVRAAGFGDSFEYVGEVDREGKRAFLQSLDLLCVPSPYQEPKGLYVLEALACGVPVVQPNHGAFPELLRSTGGGVLFPPGDLPALVAQLTELITDPEGRRALGDQGLAGVRQHHSAEAMARRACEVYRAMLNARSREETSSQ